MASRPSSRQVYSPRATISPRRMPPNPAPPGAHDFRMGASPQAVEWWDTHVYRTHLRSPISTPHDLMQSSTLGLSPRALKARSMQMAGIMARSQQMATPLARPSSSERPGSGRPTSPRLAPLGGMPIPSTHPIYKDLIELYRGMKLIDHDGDGFLSPTDIVRGLATFGLSSGDDEATKKVNQQVMRNMKPNGMVGYSGFIKGLGDDPYITNAILATTSAAAAAKAQKDAEREEARLKAINGPQLRPGVTANELRQAQTLIKDKLLDKYSSLNSAFRSVDKDGSGFISRPELEMTLRSLNLDNIRTDVIDTLVDFIDCENNVDDDEDCGPTDIQFREFSRAFATDDIMKMRPVQTIASLEKPPPTPPPHNTAPTQLVSIIKTKFKPDSLKKAFDYVDVDRDHKLSRAEVKRALYSWGTPLDERELDELFSSCDGNGDGKIDYTEFLDMVKNSPAMLQPREMAVQPALRAGVRASDMRSAQKLVRDSIMKHYKRIDAAFKHMDANRSGFVTRADLLQEFKHLNLTGLLKPEVAENLIDFIDIDDGGKKIDYKEFARVISADDVMEMAPLKAVANPQVRTGHGAHNMDAHAGNVTANWSTVSG